MIGRDHLKCTQRSITASLYKPAARLKTGSGLYTTGSRWAEDRDSQCHSGLPASRWAAPAPGPASQPEAASQVTVAPPRHLSAQAASGTCQCHSLPLACQHLGQPGPGPETTGAATGTQRMAAGAAPSPGSRPGAPPRLGPPSRVPVL